MGRPSLYTDELSEYICEQIAEGTSLRKICAQDEMPNIVTIMRWLAANEDFASRYARAREIQGDVMDAKVLDVADECTPNTAAADRVKIAAYQWRAAKLRPKVYGDKQQVEHSGNIGIGTALDALPDA